MALTFASRVNWYMYLYGQMHLLANVTLVAVLRLYIIKIIQIPPVASFSGIGSV